LLLVSPASCAVSIIGRAAVTTLMNSSTHGGGGMREG
jgi:hypothetical protein